VEKQGPRVAGARTAVPPLGFPDRQRRQRLSRPRHIALRRLHRRRSGGLRARAELSLLWTVDAARKLAPGGRVLLYTGSAIVDGRDALRERLERELPALRCSLRWRELDPDIFGEELAKPHYEEVERIAAIGAVVEKASE
jgi:hypothetical protein